MAAAHTLFRSLKEHGMKERDTVEDADATPGGKWRIGCVRWG
jgi:hypothetical protein